MARANHHYTYRSPRGRFEPVKLYPDLPSLQQALTLTDVNVTPEFTGRLPHSWKLAVQERTDKIDMNRPAMKRSWGSGLVDRPMEGNWRVLEREGRWPVRLGS